MLGDNNSELRTPFSNGRPIGRERSPSNISTSSASSLASASSTLGANDSRGSAAVQVGHDVPPSKVSAGSDTQFLGVKHLQRSRSHSRGRNNSDGFQSPDDSSRSSGILSISRSRSRPRMSQGPIYQILNNFKPFCRDRESNSRSSDAIKYESEKTQHSPASSSAGSRRSFESSDDLDEFFEDRGRRTLRNRRQSNDRSASPSLRRMKLFPSLATLVPSTNNSSDQSAASSIAESTRRVLTRRSRSSSRTNHDEAIPAIETSNTQPHHQPSLPPISYAINSQARRPSSSTMRSLTSSEPRSRSVPDSSGESESLRHSELPFLIDRKERYTIDEEEPSSRRPQDDANIQRHVPRSQQQQQQPPVPQPQQQNSQPQVPRLANRDKLGFLRVYRPDGTFGTIACPIDITAERLIQLTARKFFISEVDDYQLVALKPASVRILRPDAKPARFIRDLLVHAGYHSTMDRINDVSRDDTSFLCRIVLANINEPLRPPLLMQGIRDLILVDTDVRDAPSLACADARHVETLDVSRSAFEGTMLTFPRLRHLRITKMFLPCGHPATELSSQLRTLMMNLTRLDLSGSGLSTLEGVDFTEAPHLTYLDLRGNQLTDLPQMLLHLPFLEILLCGTNALTHFDVWNPSLYKIDLSYNKFSRLLLREEQAIQMRNLTSLQLCANSLDTLPSSLHLLPALTELDVRHNMIVNPLEAMTPSIHKLVASYNNPRTTLNQRESSSASASASASTTGLASRGDPHDSKVGVSCLPNIRHLKLEGLHTLELHETLAMANITCLDMRNTHMPFVHESLFQNSPNLQRLDLSNNSLTRLPASIGQLRYLEELYVSNNSLVDLPAALFQLEELTILDAHANNLKSLPLPIETAPSLRILNLASNLISSLPSSNLGHSSATAAAAAAAAGAGGAGVTTALAPTASIVQLILCDNQLTEDCFEVVLQSSFLRVLDLSYNFITELPSRVFSQLPLLEELYLSGNRISTLPHDDFLQATYLRVLRVNGNKLPTLPAELSKATNLEELDVAANQLRYNVANWPFDWNWRWNQKLRYLNFSANRRLEIRKSPQFIDEETGVIDLGDLCVLPKLVTLGLMDVTLTTNKVPFQTENCRVRTFGSDLQKFRVGIAESMGFRPLANNDLVIERFRNKDDEFLVAMFDGQNENPGGGNKLSHLAQDCFAALLKRELQAKDTTTVDALRRAFLVTHREIGNTALLSSEEIAHTALGHRSPVASKLTPEDWSAGTGATVLYIQGQKLYVATVGGARVVLSRANGTHTVLSKPLPPVAAELDRIRSSGGIIDPARSYVNNISAFPRLIGCYVAGTAFSAAPSIYEYEFEALNVSDQIIIGSSAMWEVMQHETAADIVRSSAQDPVLAAMKLRDFTTAYGNRDRMMAMVVGRPFSSQPEALGRQSSNGDIYEDEIHSYRQRRQSLPEDSTLARLGTEVSPPFGDVTMVFTDIKNSTYLWESYPSVMQAAIKTHNSLMRRSIRLMDGYEVKNEGDAFIISFHTPVKALIWCLTVQQHLLTAEWPPELLEVDGCSPVYDENQNVLFRGLSVRMGIHCGRPVAEPDPVTKRMDYFGPMVNRASRISGIALGGQISVSSDFLNTLQLTLDAHKRVRDEGVGIEEAYSFTKPNAAHALERSATVLDHTEYVVKELGELKLRGIENPEHIYNIYPVSLAPRQRHYDENDIDEHPQIDTSPFVVGRDSVTSAMSPLGGSISAVNGLGQRNMSEALAVPREASITASMGLPTVASLSGVGVAPSAPPGPVSEGGHSALASPMLSAEDLQRRASEALSVMSRESSRSIEYPEREPRSKHSLHMNPPHLNTSGIPSGLPLPALPSGLLPSAETSEQQLVAAQQSQSRESQSQQSQQSQQSHPQQQLQYQQLQESHAAIVDQIHSLSKRLEAACLATTSGLSLPTAQHIMTLAEPPVALDPAVTDYAPLLWVTRIENAVSRIREILNERRAFSS